MRYLHSKSGIGYHGNLKSTNSIVDGYWKVKLSSFGMERIREGEKLVVWREGETLHEGMLLQ